MGDTGGAGSGPGGDGGTGPGRLARKIALAFWQLRYRIGGLGTQPDEGMPVPNPPKNPS